MKLTTGVRLLRLLNTRPENALTTTEIERRWRELGGTEVVLRSIQRYMSDLSQDGIEGPALVAIVQRGAERAYYLKTSQVTLHNCRSTAEAEALVREAVLTREMPGEVPSTRWGILRVFMRNLVNRSQPAMGAQAMLRCLNEVASLNDDEAIRTAVLINAVAGNAQLNQSLQAVLERDRAPDGYNDYLDWFGARIEEYRQTPVSEINVDRVLNQLRHIAFDRNTKIPNMGIALASNLFADLGIRVVGKPDLHVLPTVQGLLGVDSLKPEACIR